MKMKVLNLILAAILILMNACQPGSSGLVIPIQEGEDPSDDFSVLAGSANFCYPSLHLGAAGGIISLANAFPDPCCELYQLFVNGIFDKARDLHFRLARLNAAVSGTSGVAGVKAAMEIAGYEGGAPRHPLRALSTGERTKIVTAIRDSGFEG